MAIVSCSGRLSSLIPVTSRPSLDWQSTGRYLLLRQEAQAVTDKLLKNDPNNADVHVLQANLMRHSTTPMLPSKNCKKAIARSQPARVLRNWRVLQSAKQMDVAESTLQSSGNQSKFVRSGYRVARGCVPEHRDARLRPRTC